MPWVSVLHDLLKALQISKVSFHLCAQLHSAAALWEQIWINASHAWEYDSLTIG
jgi:hypothetical protein